MNYAGKFDATFASEGPDTHSQAYVHVDSSQTHAPADAIIVPDAQLLFHADYSRSGSDLILSRDHHEYVVHDYFRGEKRALASQDGAHLTADIVKALVGEVEVSQAGTAPVASEVIGHVTKLQGSATVIRNGVSVILNMGDNVEKGDVVQSGANSTVGITFIDGTVFGLSANARMVLNEMVYDPNGSNNSSLLSLVAGTITFVAGETAKHGDMKIDTPVATMGIRGTAVLVEIDFTVPGQNAQPNASFQVLVEPDGTTGSYILFDKTTLQPIAVVNQAGQQVNINNGVINITTNPLTPDLQKLITDVFQQKFTDNTNPNTKSTAPSTDSIVPTSNPLVIKTAEALIKTQTVNVTGSGTTAPPAQPTDSTHHIPGAPIVHIANLLGVETSSFLVSGELAGVTGSLLPDGAAGIVSFNDINVGDQPSVSAAFSSFTYKNAHGQNVTAGLSPLQLADIAATEVNLTIIPGAHNTNIGSALFTYSIADQAFDFLAAGEQITLTYTITVNDNFAPAPDIANIPITITIIGTNDGPVITTGPQTIAFSGGTSVPGGPLQILPTSGPPSGTLAFTDVDLTDTHTVQVDLETPVLTDSNGNVVAGFNVAPAPLAAFEQALKASIATDSTGTGNGLIDWTFVAPKSFNADIIPAGDTLTLTYDVTVADGFGGTKTQTVTVTILGTDNPAVVWIATTTPVGTTGGLWSDTANWETGTVPTATDDTIVVTNQLLGLTPAFPTTINAAAVAHSLTMNDFNIGIGTKPTLINQSTLDVGDGGISLDADAAIDNEGSMSVAGAFKFHDQDPAANAPAAVTLTNTGTLVLSGGGDFTGLAIVTNTGIFELSAGTLDVAVNIANALNATVAGAIVTNDNTSGAKPVTADTLLVGPAGNGSDHLGTAIIDGSVLTVDGKTITFSTAQTTLTVDASGNVTVGIGTGSTLTVGDVLSAIDGITGTSVASFVNAGEILLFTGAIQNLVISGTGNVLAALGLAAGTTDYAGAIDVTGTLVLEDNGGISNASMANTVTVQSTGVLTLEGASFISGGTVSNEGTLNLQGTSELENGTLFNSGHVYVSGPGNSFDGEAITNIGTNADIQIDGDFQQPATLKLKGGASITQGKVTIGSFGVLEVAGPLGATLDDVIVNDGNSILVDAASLLLLKSTSITGTGTVTVSGELDNASGISTIEGAVTNTGTIDVKAGTTLDLAGGLSGVGTVKIDAGATLKLAGAPAETFTFTGGSGTSTLELDSTTLPFNGTITANVTAGGTFAVIGQGNITTTSGDGLDFNGTSGDPANLTLTLDGAITGAANGIVVTQNGTGDVSVTTSGSVKGLAGNGIAVQDSATGFGNLTVDATGQVTGTGAGSVGLVVQNLNVANNGNIQVTATGGAAGDAFGINIDTAGNGNITLEAGGIIATGNGAGSAGIGAFARDGGDVTVTNDAGASVSGATGLSALVNLVGTIAITNDGQITGTGGDGVDVTQNATGQFTATGSTTITNSGTVTGSVDAVHILENASGTATIDNLKGGTIGSTAAGSAIYATGGHVSIDNHGTIDGTINVGNGTFTNETDGIWNDGGSNDFGTVSGSGFTIDNLGIINLSNGASLSGVGGLTITDSGIIDNQSDAGSINAAAITVTATGILESTGGTLTIDALSSVTNTAGGTVAAHGGDLVVNGTLSGTAEIFGASMIELGDSAAGAYSSATIIFEADSTGTLKIDDAANFSGTVSGFGEGTTIDLTGIAFATGEYAQWTQGNGGGTLTIYSVANVELASVHLDGTYTSNEFAVKGDGASGSDISFNTAPAVAPTVLNSAWYNFDGNAAAIGAVATSAVGNTSDGTAVTLDGWVNWNGQGHTGTSELLFYNGSTSDAGFGVNGVVTANGLLDLQIQTGGIDGIDTGITIGSGQWHNVALTHADGTFTLYVDGVAEYTTSENVHTIPGASYSDYMQIGGATISGGFSSEGFTGSIADVSVWNAALSQSQLQTTNFTALAGSEANLAAYYPLNDGSGSTVADVANHPAGDLQLTFGSTPAGDHPDWTPTQTAENTALTLNYIGVSDPAAGSNSIQVQLAVDHGSLALNNSSGITLSFDAANDIATLTGTVAGIDAALARGVVYTPASGFEGNDTLTVIANDLGNNSTGSAATGSQTIDLHVGAGPTIDTSHFTVMSNADGTTTVSGLQIDDGNPAALSQDFTITATTGDAGVTSVTPSAPAPDTLANVNSLLNSGIIYNPGANPPAQDMVTLTVTDALGNSDAVHFVFNENGSGSGTQLTGTPGNDVIFATGQPDTLTGNGGQDQFVFKSSDAGQTTTVEHTITDFNVHLDTIDLRQFDISSVASIIASATPGNDTVLTLDDHQTLLLKGVTASSLHASDFIVTPHTV